MTGSLVDQVTCNNRSIPEYPRTHCCVPSAALVAELRGNVVAMVLSILFTRSLGKIPVEFASVGTGTSSEPVAQGTTRFDYSNFVPHVCLFLKTPSLNVLAHLPRLHSRYDHF